MDKSAYYNTVSLRRSNKKIITSIIKITADVIIEEASNYNITL